MINSGECPKCGCDRIAGPHKIHGRSRVVINLPGVTTATLESLTCTNCGYTEMYADRLGLENINKYGRFIERFVGSASRSRQRTCAFCGVTADGDATFCPECGNSF